MLPEDKRKQLDDIVQRMTVAQEPDTNIRFVVDDFKSKYDKPGVDPTASKPANIPLVPTVAEPLIRRIAQVGGALGMKPLGETIASKLGGEKSPYTTRQTVGSAIQTATLAAPLGAAKTLLGKAIQYGSSGAVIGFGSALEKNKGVGDATKSALTTGAITASLPVVGKGISNVASRIKKPIGEVVSSVLGNFIGKPAEVIQKAFRDPDKVGVALAQKKIPEQIRKESLQLLSALRSESSKRFRKGLNEQQTLHPFKKTGQILVKKEFGNIQQNISGLLRQNRVAVSNNGVLNFDKLTSAIISPSERRQVQSAVDTVLKQKKFLPKDVQAVSARLSKLSKYSEGGVPQSSSLVRQIHSTYKKGLETAYPKLGTLRTNYATERKMLDEIANVLGENKWKPTSITTAVKRLSNVFKEDNEMYLKVLSEFEEKTGSDILSDLAASEFSKIAPAAFGSRVAQAGILAGGAFINPFILLVLPLFSPKVVSKATIGAAKLGRTIPKVAGKVEPLLPKAVPQILK